MFTIKHTDECRTENANVLREIQAFFARWRGACWQCGAIGYVNLSGLNLPCAVCLGAVDGNGPYCPRCHSKSIYPETKAGLYTNQGFWPSGKPCLNCSWANARDGAPILECRCSEKVFEIERVEPVTPAAAKESKAERLERMRSGNE